MSDGFLWLHLINRKVSRVKRNWVPQKIGRLQNNKVRKATMCMLLSCEKLGWSFDLRRWGVFIVTYQSSKELDAEEKMFLDLTLHFRVFLADEWVRQQCQSLEIKVWTKHMKMSSVFSRSIALGKLRHTVFEFVLGVCSSTFIFSEWEYDPSYGLVRLWDEQAGFRKERSFTLPLRIILVESLEWNCTRP